MRKLQNILIDNLQVSIKNVYIRYEDSFTEKNGTEGIFSIGGILKELSIFSTKEDFKEKGLTSGSDMMKKVLKIKDFSFFLDYHSNTKGKKGLNHDFRFDAEKCHEDKTGVVLKTFLEEEFRRKKEENKIKRGKGLEVVQEVNKTHNYLLDTFILEARISINK
jgi:hypothetical protein